jgi:hypothetical protein
VTLVTLPSTVEGFAAAALVGVAFRGAHAPRTGSAPAARESIVKTAHPRRTEAARHHDLAIEPIET